MDVLTPMQKIKNERLRRYLEAEEAILAGQKYKIGDREITQADLTAVRKAIEDLIDDGATVDDEAMKPNRLGRVVFMD